MKEDERRECGNYWGVSGTVEIYLSPVHIFIQSHTTSASPKYLPNKNIFNPSSTMSNPNCTMKTRGKNATQHPGYIQWKPYQPADSNMAAIKARKAEATTAARAAAAVVKEVNSAQLSKFEKEAMELEAYLWLFLVATSLPSLVAPCPLPLNLVLLAR